MWGGKKHGSILQEAHCQSSARGGKVWKKKRKKEEAMTCGKILLRRRASTLVLGGGMVEVRCVGTIQDRMAKVDNVVEAKSKSRWKSKSKRENILGSEGCRRKVATRPSATPLGFEPLSWPVCCL